MSLECWEGGDLADIQLVVCQHLLLNHRCFICGSDSTAAPTTLWNHETCRLKTQNYCDTCSCLVLTHTFLTLKLNDRLLQLTSLHCNEDDADDNVVYCWRLTNAIINRCEIWSRFQISVLKFETQLFLQSWDWHLTLKI